FVRHNIIKESRWNLWGEQLCLYRFDYKNLRRNGIQIFVFLYLKANNVVYQLLVTRTVFHLLATRALFSHVLLSWPVLLHIPHLLTLVLLQPFQIMKDHIVRMMMCDFALPLAFF